MYFILDRYISKIISYNIIIMLFILIFLSSIIKFIDELRKIGQGNYGFLEASIYIFLDILRDIDLFLPVAILLGAVLGLGILSTRNELIVMEVYGFNRLRIIYSLVKTAMPLILFTILVSEWVSPIGDRIARNYRYKMINNSNSGIVYSNIWIKDSNDFIYVEKVFEYNKLLGVHIYHFDKNKNLKVFRYASHARFIDHVWNLLDVNRLCFRDDNIRIVEDRFVHDVWVTVIKPSHIMTVVRSMYYFDTLSIFDIYRCIQFFNRSGQNIVHYQLRFWRKIISPLSVIVMLLIALSCIMRLSLYKLHIGMQVFVGMIYSFFFIF